MKIFVFQRMFVAALPVGEDTQHVVLGELKKVFPDNLRSVAIIRCTEDEEHQPCWNINLKYAGVDTESIPDTVKEGVNKKVEELGFEAISFKLVQIFLPTSVKLALQFNLRPNGN